MNVVVSIVAGIVVGWFTHRIMNGRETGGRFGYVVAGVLGAFVGVQVLAPMFGPPADDPNAFSTDVLISAALGAAACLFVGTMVMRRFLP